MIEDVRPGSDPFVRRVGRRIAAPGAELLRVPPRTARFAINALMRGRNGTYESGFPTPKLTAALAAQVALDELMLGVVKNPARYPKDKDFVRIARELAEALELYVERGWVNDPASYHRTPDAPSKIRVRPANALGVSYQRLQWESGYEPYEGEPGRERWLAHEPNNTAHAWAVRAGDDRPWLICIHGFGVGVPTADFFAFRAKRLSKELGLNLLFPVLPFHGPRRAGMIGGAELISQDLHGFVFGMAQAMWEIRSAIAWLKSQGAPQIGVYGMSLGAYATALLVDLEAGLDVVLAGAPISDFPNLLLHHSPATVLRRAAEHGILDGSLQQVFRVVAPLAMPPLVPTERLFLFGGTGDRMATPEQGHKLWLHWGKPAVEWYEGSHVAFLWSKEIGRFIEEALHAYLLTA